MPRVDERFWSSTRGRVLLLLRQGSHSAKELASALGLTANAVRSQLTGLERDGLVRPTGIRPGIRKPTVTYGLSPDAQQLFPKPYGAILVHLFEALRTSVPATKLEVIIRATGQRVALAMFPDGGPARRGAPVERGATVLRELGGWCTKTNGSGRSVLSCTDCPLAAVAADHPEICHLVESILADVLEMPVRQQCLRDPPKCRFELVPATKVPA